MLPQPRKTERLPAFQDDPQRLLTLPELMPLINPVRRDDAPPLLERITKRRLLSQRLGPGIDHPIPNTGILRPGRNQSPPHRLQVPLAVIAHDNDRLRRRNVVPRPPNFVLALAPFAPITFAF